jgi:Ca2+-binding EF-hand superfamily protein
MVLTDKNNDGFLQSEDLFQICVECNVKLSKEEIDNAMWLMDDNMYA